MYFLQLNPDNCKSYLLFNEKSRSAIIIDPKLDYAEAYMEILEEKRARLNLVIDTHTHSDHISGAKYLKEKTNCRYAMHERSESDGVDVKLKNNDVVDIDGITFKVIYTPGHTKDSICIAWQDKLFTGDILFLNKGVGRIELGSDSVDKYWESLLRIKGLDNHLIICPAHIYDASQYSEIETQKKSNSCLKLKSKKQFKKHMKRYNPELNCDMFNFIKDKNINGTIDINDTKSLTKNLLRQSEAEIVNDGYNLISCEELKSKLYKNDICILDVRSREEIADDQSNIIGTVNISLRDLTSNLYKLDKYMEKEIIIICRQGKRSQIAYEVLKKEGFRNISLLQGGLNHFKEIYDCEICDGV